MTTRGCTFSLSSRVAASAWPGTAVGAWEVGPIGPVVASLLPLAVVVAVSPAPIIAVVLMLLTPRAGGTSAGFLAGWIVGIAGVTAGFLLLAGNTAPSSSGGGASEAASWVQLVLGVLLLTLAAWQWWSRPAPGEEPELPSWLAAIDRFTPVRAGGLGLALSAVNPKNLLVCVAAGLAIAAGGLSAAQGRWAVVVFTTTAASTVAVPVLAYAAGRPRMSGPLESLRGGLIARGRSVAAMLLLVIGVLLLGQALTGLA
jgi:threonine/homoserine/homoserine lactone efflux protein